MMQAQKKKKQVFSNLKHNKQHYFDKQNMYLQTLDKR